MEDIKITGSIVYKIERDTKMSIYELIKNFSYTNIVKVLRRVWKCDEDTAVDKLEAILEDGGDLVKIFEQIVLSLEEGGFLGREGDLQKKIKEAKDQ